MGGSCHWCTEAIFQALKGVIKVEQGWISSVAPHNELSEAVILSFNPTEISLHTLIEVHLHTHSCTSNHGMREKYRSAIYYYDELQKQKATLALASLQVQFVQPIITQIIPLDAFKPSPEHYQNYYQQDPKRPFCENVISPKLAVLKANFRAQLK